MPPVSASKYRVQAGWSHVPHLPADVQEKLLASTPPHLRDARSKGTPSLGAGAIYPLDQSVFVCAPFAIPPHWAKGYGFDPGWNKTAAAFGAWDRDADVIYIYSEHYRSQAEPSIHADAIKARGAWLTGAADWAGTSIDGERIIAMYRGLGLRLVDADKTVEAGILEVWQLLSSGRLKVFSSCTNWLAEHVLYRRDENGKIIKANDHLMDCSRYLIRLRAKVMTTQPVEFGAPDNAFAMADRRGGY